MESTLYLMAGFILYGVMPLLYAQIGLTNNEYSRKKKERLSLKNDKRHSTNKNLQFVGFNYLQEDNKIKPKSYRIEEDDELYSK